MKTRRILALIVTIAMLVSMMGPSLAMAEEQLILDSIEIADQRSDLQERQVHDGDGLHR